MRKLILKYQILITVILAFLVGIAIVCNKDGFTKKETRWIEWKPLGNFNVTEFLERENQKLEEARVKVLKEKVKALEAR